MDKRVARNVKCPFYLKHDDNRIVCECVSKNNSLHLAFKDKYERKKYMREHCHSIQSCQTCLIHKILYEKWGMGDE